MRHLVLGICLATAAACIMVPAAIAQEDEAKEKQNSYFGSATKSEAALIGILYDLKQNQKRETKKIDYPTVAGTFIREQWDESILNEFYRVTKPIYATQFFIPLMNANEAPKAFNAEKTVQPREWVIHYKGQVSPPKSGTFRFVGLADDIMAVALDRKTVFVTTHRGSHLKNPGFRDAARDGPKTPSGPCQAGDWVTLKANEVYDMDVLLGERPGGQFGAWLMYEEQGVTYPEGSDGKPVLPVFQLAPVDISGLERVPEASSAKPNELWKSHQ